MNVARFYPRRDPNGLVHGASQSVSTGREWTGRPTLDGNVRYRRYEGHVLEAPVELPERGHTFLVAAGVTLGALGLATLIAIGFMADRTPDVSLSDTPQAGIAVHEPSYQISPVVNPVSFEIPVLSETPMPPDHRAPIDAPATEAPAAAPRHPAGKAVPSEQPEGSDSADALNRDEEDEIDEVATPLDDFYAENVQPE